MKKNNKLIEFLKSPRGTFLYIIFLLTLIMVLLSLIFVFSNNIESTLAFIVYALTALFLIYSAYSLIVIYPNTKKKIVEMLKRNKITSRLLEDLSFRALIMAFGSLTINISYAVFNGVLAIKAYSIWFGALSGYYLMLTILRGGVIFSHRKERQIVGENNLTQKTLHKWKTSKVCGIVLMLTIIALACAISEMVVSNDSFKYAGLMIYAAAAYTFYKVIISSINFIKAKKREDITVKTIKNINLADAVVSILALQTAMFQTFANGKNMSLANATTGGAVCAFILGLGMYMVIKASIESNKLKGENL